MLELKLIHVKKSPWSHNCLLSISPFLLLKSRKSSTYKVIKIYNWYNQTNLQAMQNQMQIL